MMKLKLAMCSLFAVVYASAYGQSGAVISGGNALGTNGSVSYTIGQTANQAQSANNGTVTQGLQQPYEIVVVSGIGKTSEGITAKVYPNPTSDVIMLDLPALSEKMKYALTNASGKVLAHGNIISVRTSIALPSAAEGIYFLKVLDGAEEQKTFKIIKTK